MGIVRKLSEFFNNLSKRQDHLIKKIQELLRPTDHHIDVQCAIYGLDRILQLCWVPVSSTLALETFH